MTEVICKNECNILGALYRNDKLRGFWSNNKRTDLRSRWSHFRVYKCNHQRTEKKVTGRDRRTGMVNHSSDSFGAHEQYSAYSRQVELA